MKKILILGGCGFIGHNLARELSKNFQVSIADSLQINNLYSLENNKDNLPNPELSKIIIQDRLKIIKDNKLNFVIQDLRDYHATCRLFNEIKPDIVVHLAAVSHANRSNKDPHTTFDHSLRTLENTLDYAKTKKTHVIYMSSSMVYGDFADGTREESNTKPQNIYGEAKLTGERLTKLFAKRDGLNYVIVRPSGVFGPGDLPDRVVSKFFKQAMNNETIELHNGDNKVDFTYRQDAAYGIIKAAESEVANTSFNITAGKATSLRKLAETIIDITGSESEIKDVGMHKLYPMRGTLDIGRAKDLLDYEPKFTLRQGLESYYDWIRQYTGKI